MSDTKGKPLKHEDVFKQEVLTVKDFAERAGGVSPESIYNAIKEGLVDYIIIGNHKFIVNTANTRQYSPNTHPKRTDKAE